MKFLKTFLISNVEACNLIENIFPKTLFFCTDFSDKMRISWIDYEWNIFFNNLLTNNNSTANIWTQSCRNELIEYINKFISEFEDFSRDRSKVSDLFICTEDDLKDNISYTSKNTSDNHKSASIFFNKNFYINYREIKFDFKSLKKYYFVWRFYLKKLINESDKPHLQHTIDKPKKFWGKLIDELVKSGQDWKQLLIIKTLTLIYKNYFEILGVIQNYNYFIKLFI